MRIGGYLRKRPLVVTLRCTPMRELGCFSTNKCLSNCLYPTTRLFSSTNGKQEKLRVAYLCLRDRWMLLEKHSIPCASVRASCSRWVIYFFTMVTNKAPVLSLRRSTRSNEEAPIASQVTHPVSISLSLPLSISHLALRHHLEIDTYREQRRGRLGERERGGYVG